MGEVAGDSALGVGDHHAVVAGMASLDVGQHQGWIGATRQVRDGPRRVRFLPLVSQRVCAGDPDGKGRGRAHEVGAGLGLVGDDGLAEASPDSCQEQPGHE